MVAEREAARTGLPVLGLDVVALGALVVVVMHPSAGKGRVEWGHFGHIGSPF
jgi:hypothetical protein